VPKFIQDQLKGDVEGKAQVFTRLLGDAQLKGTIDTSRTELYQEHGNLDQHQIDMYFMWVSCQTINADKKLTTSEKIKLWTEVHSAFAGQPPLQLKQPPAASTDRIFISEPVESLMHLGGDNLTSAQRAHLLAPYVGKWTKLSAVVGNVVERSGSTQVIAWSSDGNGRLLESLNFVNKPWSESAALLSVGDKLTANCKVEDVYQQLGVILNECELITP
jgi:hypothetical protein